MFSNQLLASEVPNKLKNVSSNHNGAGGAPKFYSQLDGLRCFCVLGVLLQHFITPNISHIFQTGIIGVDLFFLISGFLITENLINLKLKYPFKKAITVFYIRRVLRIFPLYYLYWIILIVFFYATVKPQLIPGLLYLMNFYDINHDLTNVTGHLWSLSVEEQFYLAWPLMVLVTPLEKLNTIIVSLFLLSTVFILFNFNKDANINALHTISCSVALLTGAFLAGVKNSSKAYWLGFIPTRSWWLLVIFGLAIALNVSLRFRFIHEGWMILLRYLVCIAGFYLIARIAAKPFKGFFGKLLSNHVISRIGKISYGIYIYHYLVYDLLKPYVELAYNKVLSNHIFDSGPLLYLRFNPSVIQFPVYAIAVIVIANLSYNIFEVRFLKLKNVYK